MKYFFLFFLLVISFQLNSFAHNECCDQYANDLRCGTFQIKKNKIKNTIQRRIYFDETGRPKNQLKIETKSRRFAIHYDTSGIHKVPTLDINQNGIPDYVDSVAFYAELVYHYQVQQLGLPDPTNDSTGGGTPGYDIYLMDIGNGDETPDSNGIMDPGGMYGFTVNDIEIYPQGKYPRYTSFMVIDNDFSPTDSARPVGEKPFKVFKTTGIDAMKITLAHEFNHAIQFYIGYHEQGFTAIAEMLSVMFEEICFPEVDDYLQYVRSLFKIPSQFSFAVSTPRNGYRYSIFFMMLYQKFGENFIKDYFASLPIGGNAYKTLDETLKNYNTNLIDEWKDFLQWIYHTGSRAIPSKYFVDANLMPDFTYATESEFIHPSVVISASHEPFQLRADRIFFPNELPYTNDTLNIISTYIDTVAAYYQIFGTDEFTISVTNIPQTNYIKIFENSPNQYFFNLNSIRKATYSALFQISASTTMALNRAYPNPIFKNEHNQIVFPVDEQAKIGEKAEISIFNSNMIEIFRRSSNVGLVNSARAVVLEMSDLELNGKLESGVYIYAIATDRKTIYGKFSVINNK